jgi:hypothetical protein
MPYWPGTLVAAKTQRNILLRAFRDTMRSLEDELKARGRVVEELELVAMMHGLAMPALSVSPSRRRDRQRTRAAA